jgi:hypothetical protein
MAVPVLMGESDDCPLALRLGSTVLGRQQWDQQWSSGCPRPRLVSSNTPSSATSEVLTALAGLLSAELCVDAHGRITQRRIEMNCHEREETDWKQQSMDVERKNTKCQAPHYGTRYGREN